MTDFSLIGSLINAFAQNLNNDATNEYGQTAYDNADTLASNVQTASEFQPFSVSGPGGINYSVNKDGGGSFSTGQDATANSFLNAATGSLADATSPMAERAGAAQSFLNYQDPKARGDLIYSSLVNNGGLGSGQNIFNTVTGMQGTGADSMINRMTGFQGDAGGIISALQGLSQGNGAGFQQTLAGDPFSDRAAFLGARQGAYDPSRGTSNANFLTGYDQQGRESSLIDMIRGGGVEARQGEVFDRLEALAQPERERQNLQLEERLFAQGRGGVRDARFGGTPEQLALAKAQQESINQNAVNAITQAREEQALRGQQVGLGLQGARQDAALQGQLRGQGLGLGLQDQAQRDSSLMQALGLGNQLYGITSGNRQAGVDATIRDRLGMGQLGLGAYDNALRERLGLGGLAGQGYQMDINERLGLGGLGTDAYRTGIQQQGVLGDLGISSYDQALKSSLGQSGVNMDALNAMLDQTGLSANMANSFMQSGYTPLRESLGLMQAFSPMSDIANTNLRSGLQYGTGIRQSGLQALTEAGQMGLSADMQRNAAIATAVSNALANLGGDSGGLLGSLFGLGGNS